MAAMSRSKLVRREQYLNDGVREEIEATERDKASAFPGAPTQSWQARNVFDPETTRMAEMMMLTTTVDVP